MSGRSGTATCALGANPSEIKRGRRLPYCLLLIALLLGAAILQKDGGAGFPAAKPRSTAQWAHLYAALPLNFEVNRGQTDPSVKFLARGRGYALFLTGREAVLTLSNPSSAADGQKPPASAAPLRLQLLGANAQAAVIGGDELPGKANYFIGNDPSKWRRNVPTYAKVRYESVYPGIDLVYYGTQGGELEYDFVVAPGADPKALTLGVETEGHAPLQITSEGNLVVPYQGGGVEFHKPIVYQTDLGVASYAPGSSAHHASEVEGHYTLDAQNHVRFELGPYDHNRPLVIDPVLVYATYVGGSGGDIGYAIAVDTFFDAYFTGVTNSTNFPIPGGGSPYQSSNKGNGDVFLTKVNAGGTQLIFSTYLGGTGTDTATALALHNGSSFITGYTNSVDFPTAAPAGVGTTFPFQQTYGGGAWDAFVAQIDTTGSTLVYSSYLGGTGLDQGQGIAVDSTGNAYVTGSTQSTNFPIISPSGSTPLQTALTGSQNAFVTKVNFSGEALIYSTYLGGSGADTGQSIQVDSSGNAYIAGYTFSSSFPTVSALQPTFGGGADAFVSKLNTTGSALTFSTFLGGSGMDEAYGLALDGSQNVYVTGFTSSTDFPTITPAIQPSLKGSTNAFVSKLNAAGSQLVYSTYLGGSAVDKGTAIAVVSSGTNAGSAFVTGSTYSSDFPTLNPIQAILGLSNNTYCGSTPCPDAFVTQINAAGTGLTYSTYLGGNGPDFGQGIALDSVGDPYLTGSTSSTNFPAISPAAPGTTYVGPYKSTLTGTAGNAFVAKIDSSNGPNISILPLTVNFGNETVSVTSALQQVTIINPSTAALAITQILVYPVGMSNTVFTETDNCRAAGQTAGTIPPGGFCTMQVAFTPNAVGSVTDQIYITDNAGNIAGTQQIITLTGSGVTAATSVTVQPPSLSFSSQNVGTVSAAQNVTITNTGTQTLNITNISTGSSTDFSQTNTCGTAPYFDALAVNQSCTISVTFSPTASGTRTASLSISDTATGSPQTVSLTGIGAAEFTLVPSSPANTNPVIIGSTQTTFVIVPHGPDSFSGNAISLACSSGATCAFSQNPVFIGQSSTLTISNLTTSLSNPYLFQVTGTSGSQTTSVQLSLEFQDFTMSATPSIDTIAAGGVAQYTIIINPLFGLNQQINLLCYVGQPPASNCSFDNATPTPSGNGPTNVHLSISTAKYQPPTTQTPPLPPNGKLPPLILGLLCLAGLLSLALGNKRRAHQGWLVSGWLGVRLAALSLILILNLALVSCRSSTLVQSGTTTGNYTITISGTLNSNNSVVRTTNVALAVTATP